MSYTASGPQRIPKWYNHPVFPLVPVINTRPADKHNTKHFSFRWLFFAFWTIDCFSLELTFVVNTHWGIGFVGLMPYFRWVVTIPCPERLSISIDRLLSRRPKA